MVCGSMWTQTCPLSHLSHTSSTTETVCLVQTSTGYIHTSILIAYVKKRYWILLKPSRTPQMLIQPSHPGLTLHIPAVHAYSSCTHPIHPIHMHISYPQWLQPNTT